MRMILQTQPEQTATLQFLADVSKSSMERDYEIKPAEYLAFGVVEYWIVGSFKQQMTANVRWRGQWKPKIVKPSQKYSPLRLPGFSLDLKRVLAAGK
jgi:Uma2 family endonuclease